MAKTRDTVTELPAQDVGFLFGTMFDLTTLPSELKHTGKIAKGEFKIVAHFPAIHEKNGTEAAYLARHRTFRGGLYATYQDGPYKIDEVNWDATNRAGVHMVTMTKYGQVVEFPTQPSKTMPGSLKLMVQELVESLKTPGFIIRCSGLGGALEPKKGTTDEYNVILLNGDVKCPKKLANHVPTKYHAEDESIFHAQMGPWCGNAEDYQKPPWIKGPGRKTRAMRSAKKQKNIELREKRNAEQMTQMGDSFFPVIPNTGGGDSALGSGRGVPQWYGAENHMTDEEVKEIITLVMEEDNPSEKHSVYRKYPMEKVAMAMKLTQTRPSLKEWIFGVGAEDYGAESAFDKLANKVAQGYIKKGKSKEEALEIGRKTAYKIGAKKYGKAGMKRKSMEGRMRRKNAEETMNFEFSNLPGLPVVPNDFGESSALMSGNSVPQWYGAEEFAAASTARPDLSREKRNVLNAVRGNYDQSFSWSACNWGPYFNRFSAEGSNKFYSVWVWERSPGVYTAMGAYGGLGQNPRLFNVGQTRDLQQAVNMAKKKLQSKQKKGYQTYSAEYISNLSNAIVQFEDSGFSSASAPPNDIYFSEDGPMMMNHLSKEEQIAFLKQIIEDTKDHVQKPYELTPGVFGFGLNGKVVSAKVYLKHLQEMASEEGNAPVQDPMELGEMANWTPMDGSEGLKRKRAESQVFALTYYLQNDVNMEDITDVSQALELYLSLNEDIAEMDASGLQKHPRYEVANRMLSDLSYRLDELQTQLPEIDVDIEMDAEYDAWRSAFTDGAAATQIHKYDRNWMQKVMNPRSRQIKSMWKDAQPSFNEELKSAESITERLGFRQTYAKPVATLAALGAAYFAYRKL